MKFVRLPCDKDKFMVMRHRGRGIFVFLPISTCSYVFKAEGLHCSALTGAVESNLERVLCMFWHAFECPIVSCA